ncbi:MAG TPA: hypothetical protein VKR06_46230 [Ktedonosporobacter sp.]|nr:hypothetical protein [Ktedonosporobacter sp.]
MTTIDTELETTDVQPGANGSEPDTETIQVPETPTWTETADELEMRALIAGKQTLKEVLVDVPEWGIQVLLRAMSGQERSIYFSWLNAQDQKDPNHIKRNYWRLIQPCMLHPRTRKPVFKSADEGTIMAEHDGAIFEMLAFTSQRLSRLDGSTMTAAKKNLLSIPNFSATTN